MTFTSLTQKEAQKGNNMNPEELYQKLNHIRNNKELWEASIDDVGSLLEHPSLKIKAKALWMLGEIGLLYPRKVSCYVPKIAELMNDCDDLVKERMLNALGRIGRADYNLIKPYWKQMLTLANAKNPKIRLAFIWASENIATNSPDEIGEYISIFSDLLNDRDTRVRMETPEIFRVLGKRVPGLVLPYLEKLNYLSENDSDRVVRIHAKGAVKAALSPK